MVYETASWPSWYSQTSNSDPGSNEALHITKYRKCSLSILEFKECILTTNIRHNEGIFVAYVTSL